MSATPRRPNPEHLQDLCDFFNDHHPMGTPVIRFALINPHRDGTLTKTRSSAWVMSGHSAMVFVDGFAGAQSLEAIGDPEPPPAP